MNSNAFNPVYCPIIYHPIDRGDMQDQRLNVSHNVHALTYKNIKNYTYKIFLYR